MARTADGTVGIDAGRDDVVAAWRASGDFAEQTLTRAEETLSRFATRLGRQQVSSWTDVDAAHCRGFVDAHTKDGRPPELATRHARRTVLRLTFRTLRQLGVDVADPTIDLMLPARTPRPCRPLTDDEITLGRAAARMFGTGNSLRRAAAWALAEATAITSELTAIRLYDVDNPRRPRRVGLPGTRRHDAREGVLTDWGSRIMARHLANLHAAQAPPEALVIYAGAAAPGQAVAQASACNAVADVLRAANLSNQHDVRPGSVRGWAGRALYDAGIPIEEVARRLGCRSLDAAAEDIALDWRPR